MGRAMNRRVLVEDVAGDFRDEFVLKVCFLGRDKYTTR